MASSDGVVTASLMSAYASVRLVIDFTVAGSPITSTAATTVYSITVTELSTGNIVRDLYLAPAPGGVVVGLDHEAPFNQALSYKAQAFDATGTLLATSTTDTATITSGTATWLKSLTAPSLSTIVTTQTIPTWTAGIAEGILWPIGSQYPIVVQDVRQAEVGQLTVLTKTAAAETALHNLLYTPGPYLLQQPGFGTADRYVTVGALGRARPVNQASEIYRAWTLPLTQVARPLLPGWSVSIPGNTYADSTAAYPLYSNRTGTYESKQTR